MCDEQWYTEGVCSESLASGVAKDYVLADGLSNPDRLLPAIHTHLPALTGRWLNAVSVLGPRQRRRPSTETALTLCL